jgi:hypothetical protein
MSVGREIIDLVTVLSVSAGTAKSSAAHGAIAFGDQLLLQPVGHGAYFGPRWMQLLHILTGLVFRKKTATAYPGHASPIADKRKVFRVGLGSVRPARSRSSRVFGSMSGRDKGEQQARGYEGFHGFLPLCVEY